MFFVGQVGTQTTLPPPLLPPPATAPTTTISLSLEFMPHRPGIVLGFVYIFGSWYDFEVDAIYCPSIILSPFFLLANRSLFFNDIKVPHLGPLSAAGME